ncbi:DUF4446 family protein [Patescibacteria group bacterium]
MVFNNETVTLIFLFGTILWLLLLSIVLFRVRRHYQRLIKGVQKKDLKSILEQVLDRQQNTQKEIQTINDALEKLTKSCEYHIQRIGIIRFNPFEDTGGSQSFSMALLDHHNNGIVITSLHARSGNRWYLKGIKSGKGVDVELSKEEQKAIVKAGKQVV